MLEMPDEEKENTRQKAVKLREQDPKLTGKAIAKLLGVSEGRISQILGKRKAKPIVVEVPEQAK
jgi:DNA-directed RNA polymerase specialized sigma subunit